MIDCTIFNGESDMLLLRLNETSDLISHHFIVECNKTFTGLEKELILPSLLKKEEYKKFEHKITHLIINEFPDSCDGSWKREEYTRNYPLSFIKAIYSPNTIVLFSDMDEIVNVKSIKYYLSKNSINKPTGIQMNLFYYNFNWIWNESKWNYAFISRIKDLTNPHHQRQNHNRPIINNGGWHLSYFMSVSEIQRKLISFSHTEFSGPEYTNEQNVSNSINAGKDLFGRKNHSFTRTPKNMILPTFAHLLPKIYQLQK